MHSVPFEGTYSNAWISEELNNLLEDYKLTNDKIFLILRDSGKIIVAGVNNCSFESSLVLLHTYTTTCLNESMFTQQAVQNVISTSRCIVKQFNHSA